VRCHRIEEIADLPWPSEPALAVASPPGAASLVEAQDLSIRFDSGGWLQRLVGKDEGIIAVDRVSLTIRTGEVLGLVGESGCGKSTLGRLLLRLLPSLGGTLSFASAPIGARPDSRFRRHAQVVFQNSDTSLNPRQTVGEILGRAIRWFAIAQVDAEVSAEVDRLLDLVRLPRTYAQRYPHQLSGGEKQRVGIARALASRPRFLVCDEAVSALDVSVQAAVLNLLRDLSDQLGVAYLFISHDIGVIAHIADRIAVMYRGTIVEEGPVDEVLRPPYHPYTELLLSSVPLIGRKRGLEATAAVRPAVAGGCKFADRCRHRLGAICDSVSPPVQQAGPEHRIRCHIPVPQLAAQPHWLSRGDAA
jgi:peptide/nickel transport system ATP-binding protein